MIFGPAVGFARFTLPMCEVLIVHVLLELAREKNPPANSYNGTFLALAVYLLRPQAEIQIGARQ